MKKIEIIYEDKDLLVVNKPAGLIVHNDGKKEQETLVDWVLENYPEVEKVGEPISISDGVEIKRPGIVHRLDKDTSGVLIIAKNQKSFLKIKKQFQDREVFKIYQAIIYGNLLKDRGIIDKPIGRNKNNFRQWLAGDKARGNLRDAITEYKVLKRSSDKQFSLLEVHPKTGRTHQIRVHLKSIHHPVVCDSLYAETMECLESMGRLALHASKIKFINTKGKTIEVFAPLPNDFKKTVDLLFNGN